MRGGSQRNVTERAAVMAVAHEEVEERKARSARQQHPAPREVDTAEPAMNMARKDNTHISNEKLLAAGGTIAGAAFLGGAFGGTVGVVVGAAAGLTVALFRTKARWKEGTRRS